MATAPNPTDDIVDEFLAARGHETPQRWHRDANKKQCPECYGLHDMGAMQCAVCGWHPTA